ncbi:anaphase spindle elongation protein [Arthroderma uncinatum]|uniref:anaphase spindle elongation protein n=1 Tax=Arthroderma uncinatum TaxID=74035 RepID=UPI00144A61AB|nr:anaphase spindle elongation protein [Arthroderma uncinatum]KAF3483275.1 anaphase spindle elongation protein [Arthroderma uncinatum]
MAVDTSYLTTQVNTIVEQLHGLFDEIGIPHHERESRESELFSALSETLHGHLRRVDEEKNQMMEEAHQLKTTIKQMESSLDGATRNSREFDNREIQISYPLNRCLEALKEKHQAVSKLHRERFEQVKKLVEALESYSSHLEPSFVSIELPPTAPGAIAPPSFDLSPTYVAALDAEFTKVYEEYNRRVATMSSLGQDIVNLWAELGTPQVQTEPLIVQHYRDSPEQLGLHESDLDNLRSRREKLIDEKNARERKLKELKAAVEALWDKLGVEEPERRSFLASNRGCGLRAINEFEEELSRLNELKRQNLHLFVEDARCRLQELWDSLYYSEEEMLDFTPAFSDVYSDALLSAHEGEITRLEALLEQRAPALQLIDKHKSLIEDRDSLNASSQDASRLMARGNKGERRDPTRLLREEKMRKRIAKELPKVEADLRRTLQQWEDEYGRPFLVHGERYLDEITPVPAPSKVPPRAKTPSSFSTVSRANSVRGPPSIRGGNQTGGNQIGGNQPRANPPASRSKTPTSHSNPKQIPRPYSAAAGLIARSPTKIPSRVPLGNLPHGNNSPERRGSPAQNYSANTVRGHMPPPRAPPPKMRDLFTRPQTSQSLYRNEPERCPSLISAGSSANVASVSADDDIYERQHQRSYTQPSIPKQNPSINCSVQSLHSSNIQDSGIYQQQQSSFVSHSSDHQYRPTNPANRQISNSTIQTVTSGSENWETYDDASEPEADATEVYYAKLRATHGKRMGTPGELGGSKKIRGIRGVGADDDYDTENNYPHRVDGSDAWTDDLEQY